MPERRLASFALLALLSYAALELAWPLVADPWAAFFRSACELALHSFGVDVRAEPASGAGPDADTLLVFSSGSSDPWGFYCSSHGSMWVPLAVFLSLWLATPLTHRRRWQSLGLGLLVLLAYVVLRLGLAAAFAFSVHECALPEKHAGFLRGPTAQAVLGVLNGKVLADLVLGRLGPMLVWLVTVGRWWWLARTPRPSAG